VNKKEDDANNNDTGLLMKFITPVNLIKGHHFIDIVAHPQTFPT